MVRMRVDDAGRPPDLLLDFPAWCELVLGLPGVGFDRRNRCWWAAGLPRSEWRRVYDAGAAWAAELQPYRDRWPAEFLPFDVYVGDVTSQLPIDPADVVAELVESPHGWRVIHPGGAGKTS